MRITMFLRSFWLKSQPLVNSCERFVTNYASSAVNTTKFKQSSGCRIFSRRVATTSWSLNVISSPYPDVHIPQDKHLAEHILQHCSTYGDSVALVDAYTGQTYTYNEFKDKVVSVSSALRKRGFKEGDVLAIYCPNCPDWAIALVGTVLAGGTISAANPQYTTGELASQLVRSNSKFLITHQAVLKNALKAANKAPNIQEIFVIGGSGEGSIPFSVLLEDDRSSFCDNLNISPTEDIAALPYSSGTTGLPKGVMLTHTNIVGNIEQILHNESNLYGRDDTLLAVLPFYHIYGQVVVLLGGLSRGAKIVTLPKFEVEKYLQATQDHRATSLQIVPPIGIFLAKHPMVDKFDLSSINVVMSAAAPMDEELGKLLHDRIKFKYFGQGYGLTETSPVTHLKISEEPEYGSIGHAVPNTKYKVVDVETGEALPPGQQGELWISGPQIMKGYADNPEATAKTIKDGWLLTGDLGHYDTDGHVFISDRLKELIKYKGFQVPPAELEGILLTHPGIQDSAVVGMKDEVAGELPRAYVVRKPGVSLSEKEVQAFVEEKVAPFKKLRGGVVFIDQIPKTASGKILRRILRDQA